MVGAGVETGFLYGSVERKRAGDINYDVYDFSKMSLLPLHSKVLINDLASLIFLVRLCGNGDESHYNFRRWSVLQIVTKRLKLETFLVFRCRVWAACMGPLRGTRLEVVFILMVVNVQG